MHSFSHNDVALLLSLGTLPLVGCTFDVPDGLTVGNASLTTVGDGSAGTEGDGEDTGGGGGPGGNASDPGADAGPASASSDGGTNPNPTSFTGGDPSDDGGVDESGYAGSGGYGSSEICATWGAHATECGLEGYAAEYCQEDLDLGGYLGAGCASAMEDYYSCLSTTQCAALTDDPALCGRDQVATTCGIGPT